MDIFLITSQNDNTLIWEETIKLAAPTAKAIPISIKSWKREIDQCHIIGPSIAILLNPEIMEGFTGYMKDHNISVICICEDFKQVDVSALLGMGVKALANRHLSIERLSDIIRIVERGGIYIEAANEIDSQEEVF